jgi:hypothetical protein
MSDLDQQGAEAKARHFVLTTVWQGLSELADQINAETDRIATLTMDPAAELGKVTLLIYPVGSQPAQATPLFRYDIATSASASGVSVRFAAQPAVVNGELHSQEQGKFALPGSGEGGHVTPRDVGDDAARRYQAVMAAETARDGGR